MMVNRRTLGLKAWNVKASSFWLFTLISSETKMNFSQLSITTTTTTTTLLLIENIYINWINWTINDSIYETTRCCRVSTLKKLDSIANVILRFVLSTRWINTNVTTLYEWSDEKSMLELLFSKCRWDSWKTLKTLENSKKLW